MVADGRVYYVKGRGDIQIKLENGKKFMFSNVLYILGLNKNLLSINMITKQNPQLEVVFRGEKCFVKYKKGEKVIATGVKEHGLYKLLDENVVQSHALAIDTENSCGSNWHQRYGHLNSKYLSILNKQEMVNGLPLVLEEKDICVA